MIFDDDNDDDSHDDYEPEDSSSSEETSIDSEDEDGNDDEKEDHNEEEDDDEDDKYKKFTIIFWAMLQDNDEFVDFLLDNQVDIWASTIDCGPIIYAAISMRKYNYLQRLMEDEFPVNYHGSVPQVHSYDSYPLLDLAIKLNDCKMVEYLISMGAQINLDAKVLMVAGIPVCEEGKKAAYEEEFQDFWEKCEEEVETLKRLPVNGTDLTYFDLLHRSKDELTSCLQNFDNCINIEEALKKTFPVYGGMIAYRIIKSTKNFWLKIE
ncbi:uncharacterized protein LOC123272243 [Cotesia glomerata]|uniref:uncharacterized protein LOC123272243 n=1 Tax=Cotesia glomerata TaxID=32391 RepID=UPI001D00D0BA|nr:uncharacterized protein LOC123272243 [Cotesia glomerata]